MTTGTELERAKGFDWLPGSLRALHDDDRLTATALVIDDPTISFDSFSDIAGSIAEFRQGLRLLTEMTQFWAGDLINAGETLFGDGAYQAFERLELTPGAMQDWRRVSSLVPPNERRQELTWTHHRIVANRPPEQRANLLQQAVDDALSVHAFRDLVHDLDQEVQRAVDSLGVDNGSRPGSGIVVEHLVSTAKLVRAQAQIDGDGRAVIPAAPWQQFVAALGEED